MTNQLPSFEDPPVVEVAISLQFAPLEPLRTPQLGLLWSDFRRLGYTNVEEHGELEPAFEDFSSQNVRRVGIRIQSFDDVPPTPRLWFLNSGRSELIQIQRDRLIVNWRRGADAQPYPRYVHIIKRFREALETLQTFVESEKIGNIVPNQCEVTYINHIASGSGWSSHGELSNVLTTWRTGYTDSYLGLPEDVAFRARYRMQNEFGQPLGRLTVALEPAFSAASGSPILVLNMTGRGAPESADLESVYKLFDREHEWIVRGFASITTKHMHEIWRRIDG